VRGQLADGFQILAGAAALGDAREDFQQPLATDPARYALAARLGVAKVRKYFASSTMQVSSSTTIMPPLPMTAPAPGANRNPPGY